MSTEAEKRALPATLVVAADPELRGALEEVALPLGPVVALAPSNLGIASNAT